VNVLLKSGKGRRLPRDRAEQLIDSGQARHYISNTVYRAMVLGIEVEDPKTRDPDGELRAKIREAKAKLEKKKSKADKKREKEERELLDEDAD
jgi:hypothetical protein